MRKIPSLLLLTFLLFGSQLRASPPAAVLQRWHYDPQTRMVTMVIANTTGKDITAYDINTTITYADHSVDGNPNGSQMRDMLGAYLFLQRVKGTPDEDRFRKEMELVHGGNGVTLEAYRTLKVVFGPSPKVVTDLQVTINAVAFADGTGEATNEPALERIREHRNWTLRSHQKAKQIINEVLADPTIQNPAEEAAARLQKFLTQWNARTHYNGDVDIIEDAIIENDIRNLNGASRVIAGRHLSGEPEFLQQYLEEKDQYMALVAKHVQLKEVAQ